MIFKEKKENSGWTYFWYTTTWKMWYEFILCAAEELIKDDLHEHLGRVAFKDMSAATECLEAVKANDFNIRQCGDLCNEHGSVIVSGFSKIMECPMQFEFHNQTNLCSVAIPRRWQAICLRNTAMMSLPIMSIAWRSRLTFASR